MKSRFSNRFSAIFLVLALATAPSFSAFGAARNRETARTPRERIVQIIKQIRNVFMPTSNDEGVIPPKPTGNG